VTAPYEESRGKSGGCACVCVGGGEARKGQEGLGFLRKGMNDFGVVDGQQESDTLRNYSIQTADVGWSCGGEAHANTLGYK